MVRLAFLATVALLAAAPAASAATYEVRVSGFSYEPKAITIAPDDFIIWRFTGRDRNHTITSLPGQDESFESDPGRSPSQVNLVGHPRGSIFSHKFVRPGDFAYLCRVHDSMRGRVRVRFPQDEGVPLDTARPRLRRLRASRFCRRRSPARRCRRRGVRFVFRLSEGSMVQVRISRGRRVFRTFSRRRGRGRGTIHYGARGLRRGRYRATLTATDSSGNQSAASRVRFRVLRR